MELDKLNNLRPISSHLQRNHAAEGKRTLSRRFRDVIRILRFLDQLARNINLRVEPIRDIAEQRCVLIIQHPLNHHRYRRGLPSLFNLRMMLLDEECGLIRGHHDCRTCCTDDHYASLRYIKKNDSYLSFRHSIRR